MEETAVAGIWSADVNKQRREVMALVKLNQYEQWEAEQPVLRRMLDEIDRVGDSERYRNNKEVQAALQELECWIMEEQVELA